MAILDTTVLIDLLRQPTSDNHRRATQRVAALRHAGENLTTTRLNVAELFVGVELSADSAAEEARVEEMLSHVSILNWTSRQRAGLATSPLTFAGRAFPPVMSMCSSPRSHW